MGDGFTNINCTIAIEKLSGTEIFYDADIFDYKETPIERKITYTKVISGLILPKTEAGLSKEINFNFISNDLKFEDLFDDSQTSSQSNWDVFDKYKISLTFTSDALIHKRIFYNAYIISYESRITDEILEGDIKFSFPLKNINGDSNFYVYDSNTDNDSVMGW